MLSSAIKTFMILPITAVLGCTSVSATRQLERTVDVADTGKIVLTVISPNGDIRIQQDDTRSDVRIVAMAKSEATTESGAQERLRSFGVSVGAVGDRHWRIEPDFGGVRRGSDAMGFLITVPRLDDARVWTGNGAISIASAHGELDLETANGAVQVGPTSGGVRVKTGNGAVQVGPTRGSISVSAGNGAVTCVAGDLAAAASIELRTGNGRIRLDLGDESIGELTATTGNGRITDRVDDGAVLASTRSGSLRSRGTGASEIDLRTGNGSIDITRSLARSPSLPE